MNTGSPPEAAPIPALLVFFTSRPEFLHEKNSSGLIFSKKREYLKPVVHVTASAVVSAIVFGITRSVNCSVVSFFTGFLIDIDHVFDYLREYGFQPDRKKFFRVFYENRFDKVLLVFHGWEWIAVLFSLSYVTRWNEPLLGVGIGVLHHLILDQMGNNATGPGYFFFYRAAKGFALGATVKGNGST